MPGGDPNPEGLLSEARAGDGASLGQLLEIYRNYLWMLAELQISRRLQAKVDASDIVQETFLEAHRGFGGFRGSTEAELLRWLRSILGARLHKLFRRYGSLGRDVRAEVAIEEDLDRSSLGARGLAISQSTPSRAAVRSEQAVLLADALSQLPPHYREVLLLRHVEGLSVREVAWRMKRSVDSARHVWVRALAALHDVLGSQSDGLL